MSWKKEYIEWYRLAEKVLGNLIPHLSDNQVLKFVSPKGWLIIPTSFEEDKKESINRPDPNIYISLNDNISVGIHCNTLESVRRLRNIMLSFYSVDKVRLIHELQKLDRRFTTGVERKIKEYYWGQSPEYETEFEVPSHKLSDDDFQKIFQIVDDLLEDGEQRMKEKNEHWRAIAPVINITKIDIPKNEDEVKQVLRKLRTIYEILLGIRAPEEIRREARKGKAKCPECGAKLLLERETGDVYCSKCDFIFSEEKLDS